MSFTARTCRRIDSLARHETVLRLAGDLHDRADVPFQLGVHTLDFDANLALRDDPAGRENEDHRKTC
jgi:hypothetical protein